MYKRSTQKHRRFMLKKHLLPRFGDRPLSDITRQESRFDKNHDIRGIHRGILLSARRVVVHEGESCNRLKQRPNESREVRWCDIPGHLSREHGGETAEKRLGVTCEC